MKIDIIIKDKLYISNKLRISNFIEILKEQNTHWNPKYTMLKRLHKCTYGTLKLINAYELEDNYFCLPRGQIGLVNKIAKSENIKINWIDQTSYPELHTDIDITNGTLDIFQGKALLELTKYKSGCLVAPTGSGKTAIALSCIREVRTPTLFLVHTRELLYQTQKRISEWLNCKVGIIGDGKYDEQEITVAMIQTLTNLDIKNSSFAKRWGLVLADEIHHGAASTWWNVINNLHARFKYGFSATPWRKDKMEFLIWSLIGPIRHTVTNREVIKAGRIIAPTIVTVDTKFEYESTGPADWGIMITKLINDKERNNLIKKTIEKNLTKNNSGLLLTDRIAHADILFNLLKEYNPILLTGKLDKINREKAFTKIKKGCNLTIATTSLLGEGIDVPSWDMLFQATPLSKSPRVLQTVGRILRVKKGKTKATLFDFLDINVEKLVKAYGERKKLYE